MQFRRLFCLIDKNAKLHKAVKRGHRKIVPNSQLQEKRLLFAIFGHKSDAVLHRITWRANSDVLAVNGEALIGFKISTKNGAGKLGSPRAHKPRYA